jgi:subtilisin family serine protease
MRGAVAWALLLVAATPLSGCFEPASNGWATTATQIDLLRADGNTGAGIRVAILDTGIDLDHPSLRHLTDGSHRNGELAGYSDFLGQSGKPRDRSGHGTFVAGVLAARAPDGLDAMTSSDSAVLGLAPGVDLLVGRACETSHCAPGAMLQAIRWAIAEDADIISLSIGYTANDLEERGLIVERIQQALLEAEAKGILVAAAAGNSGAVRFPASESTVLAVGATDREGGPWVASARGDVKGKPDLAAPGENIVGPGRNGGRVIRDGTSAAVPFVVAAAALMMSSVGDPATADEVALLRQALLDGAQPLPGQARPYDLLSGRGILQGMRAKSYYELRLAALDHGLS